MQDSELCGYVCFFNGKRLEVYAPDMFKAREEAEKQFRPAKSKRHMISVVLAEKNGQTVTHTADF